MKKLVILCLLILTTSHLHAQKDSKQGESLNKQELAQESSKSKSSFRTVFSGNPGKAALYSFLLPGAGQAYNKQYWKIPIIYAIEGTAAYFIISNRRSFNGFNTCYKGLISDLSSPLPECRGITSVHQAFVVRNQYRKYEEYSWVSFFIIHMIQTLEAYIGRHLMEFDVSEDLSISPIATPIPSVNGMNFISIKLNLNKQKSPNKTYINP